MASNLYRFILLAAVVMGGLFAFGLQTVSGMGWPTVSAASLFIVLGGHAAILGAAFLLIRRLNRASPIDSAYPVVGTGNLLTAWLTEVPSVWFTYFYLIPFRGNRRLPSGADPDKLPLVLLHGFTCNRAVWRPIAHWLANQGYAITAPNLEPLNGSIDGLTAQIEAAVQELRMRTGAKKVGLIGHSMGGIAIRAYLRDYGPDSIEKAVTIGSPHGGTRLAHIARSEAKLPGQLRLDSNWLRELAGTENDKTGHLFSIIASTEDNVISPASIQTIPGSRVVYFAGLGHLDLVYRTIVWQAIRTAIEDDRPDPASSPEHS